MQLSASAAFSSRVCQNTAILMPFSGFLGPLPFETGKSQVFTSLDQL